MEEILLDKNIIIKIDETKRLPLGELITSPASSQLFEVEEIGNNLLKVKLAEKPSNEVQEIEMDQRLDLHVYQSLMQEKFKPHRFPKEEREKGTYIILASELKISHKFILIFCI